MPGLAQSVETPFYCYSAATIRRHFTVFSQAVGDLDAMVCYAMKANSNQAVLTLLARLGAGMDVVSEGELRRARAAGVPGEKITFSGVGKTDREIALALDYGIFCFNVESEPELERISQIAASRGADGAGIACASIPTSTRRPTPRSPPASRKTSSAFRFRSRREVYAWAAKLPGLKIAGVDMHIGSQITDLAPFDNAFAHSCRFRRQLRADGHAIAHVDLGGGLGIPYSEQENPESYRPGTLRGNRSPPHQAAGRADVVRTGAADRRQCRGAGDTRHLCQTRRGEKFRHRRRGDERSRAADALRGPSRYFPGGAAGRTARRTSRPISSARSAKPAIILA